MIKRLGDTATNATNDKQHSAAVAALVAQAKLAGFWVERTEAQNTNMNYAISDKPMSEEEWEKRYAPEH